MPINSDGIAAMPPSAFPPNTNNKTTTPAAPGNSSVLYAKLSHAPPRIISSKGNYLVTETGLEIFDATCGAAVVAIGHNDPRVNRAITDQLNSVAYCYSPFFTTPVAEKLSKFLTDSTGGAMERVFIVSSGTEAIEASLKMARQYFTELPQPQMQRTRFIARKQSYHGNTLGALAAGHHVGRRTLYEQMLSTNVSHVSPCYPYRGKREGETDAMYVERLAQELEDEFQRVGPETVCAFVAETMSGTTLGGVPPVPGYFRAVKEVCDRHGALLIMDEVMSGMGRTGTLHAWEQEGVVPDLQTVAKGLGSGYAPIGALLISKRVVNVLSRGTGAFVHSQTYQGHPVACAAALEVQKIIQEEKMLENAKLVGEYLGKTLKERVGGHKHVGDVRGRGMFWGIEFVQDKQTKEPFPAKQQIALNVHATGLKAGFGISLIPGNGVADGKNGDIVLISPAYNISLEDADIIVERVEKAIKEVLG